MTRALIVPPMAWAPEFRSFVPGTAPNPFRIYEEMRSHGLETEIADPFPRPWNPFAGQNTLLESLDPFRAIRTALRRKRFDLVVSVFEGGATPLVLLRALRLFNRPVYLWDIGLTETWKLRERILDFTVPRVDGVMVLGTNQVACIRERWRYDGEIAVIGHHVDTDFFHPMAATDGGAVLSVGDDIGRDFATLLQAARGLDREVVIKASRHSPAIPPDVTNARVIRERLSYVQLRDLYAAAEIVVVPTHVTMNACGVSTILEASAMGKPLVVSDNPGIHDFIVPDETCLVVPPGAAGALHEALRALMADKALRDRLGANARQFALEKCRIPLFAKNFAQAIGRLINGSEQ